MEFFAGLTVPEMVSPWQTPNPATWAIRQLEGDKSEKSGSTARKRGILKSSTSIMVLGDRLNSRDCSVRRCTPKNPPKRVLMEVPAERLVYFGDRIQATSFFGFCIVHLLAGRRRTGPKTPEPPPDFGRCQSVSSLGIASVLLRHIQYTGPTTFCRWRGRTCSSSTAKAFVPQCLARNRARSRHYKRCQNSSHRIPLQW